MNMIADDVIRRRWLDGLQLNMTHTPGLSLEDFGDGSRRVWASTFEPLGLRADILESDGEFTFSLSTTWNDWVADLKEIGDLANSVGKLDRWLDDCSTVLAEFQGVDLTDAANALEATQGEVTL